MLDDKAELNKRAVEHAWNWFSLHAVQRMQTFNFFLVATAFLIAAYATLLDKHADAAVIIACIGAWIAYWFNRLDFRVRQFIYAGENALLEIQKHLSETSDFHNLEMLKLTNQPTCNASTYGTTINILQKTIMMFFIVAAAYAIWPHWKAGICAN